MEFNLVTFLFEIVNFLVLAFVLHRLLYRPLRKAIDQRHEANVRAQADAEKARQEATALQEKASAHWSDLEQERQQIIRQAHAQAESERQNLLAETERTVERRQKEAQQFLERDRQEAVQVLRTELVAHAIDVAQRLLQEAANTTLHEQLVRHLVEALQTIPESERDRLRLAWQTNDETVIEAAAPIDAKSVQDLTRVITEVVGRPVPFATQVCPALISGARLCLGGHVWDASLAGRLEEAQQGGGEEPGHD